MRNSNLKSLALLVFMLVVTSVSTAQIIIPGTNYTVQTILNGNPVVYENNRAVLRFNSNSKDLTFNVNLASFVTGNDTVDKKLVDMIQLPFVFTGNLGRDLYEVAKRENLDSPRKVAGKVSVNTIDYPIEATVSIKNMVVQEDIPKALFSLYLEVDPKVVYIPHFSEYFDNSLTFIVVDDRVNKYGD